MEELEQDWCGIAAGLCSSDLSAEEPPGAGLWLHQTALLWDSCQIYQLFFAPDVLRRSPSGCYPLLKFGLPPPVHAYSSTDGNVFSLDLERARDSCSCSGYDCGLSLTRTQSGTRAVTGDVCLIRRIEV